MSESNEESKLKESIKDAHIKSLKLQIAGLQTELQANLHNYVGTYYSTADALTPFEDKCKMPEHGISARHAKERIKGIEQLDFKPTLNTSSYVNVVSEPEELDVALLGLTTNIADASVYPASMKIHDMVVNMIAKLWNCPEPKDCANYSGAGTVGSTEACLLAGLALKFRWRKWYGKTYGLSEREVLGVRPNLVINTCYQACWEKFFRYFDVDPKFVKPTAENKLRVDPQEVADACDEKTIGVVAILGNHYNGAYDPVWDIDVAIEKLNEEKGYQVGIHVDAASGGFIAPFQEDMPPFDFRLKNVITMSASGHKFGESVCGTGWVIFRQRENLAEHIAVSVSYLGGKSDSMTLNFSRPASGVYVQYYKFLRLGLKGYASKVANQMAVAAFLRSVILSMEDKNTGKPLFLSLDCGDIHCLPVVGARLNPEVTMNVYNDIDFQHALYESRWYVSGYSLAFENFMNDNAMEAFTSDLPASATMFRIVCKSNLTYSLAQDLAQNLQTTVHILSKVGPKNSYSSTKRAIRKFKAGVHIVQALQNLDSSVLEEKDAGPPIEASHSAC